MISKQVSKGQRGVVIVVVYTVLVVYTLVVALVLVYTVGI